MRTTTAGRATSGPENTTVTSAYIATLLCPSDTPKRPVSTALGVMSGLISSHNYVVNFGSTDVDQQPTILGSTFAGAPFTFIAPYSNADHVASPNKGKTIGLANITDGTSNTMLASELITGADNDLRGLTWWADGTTYTSYLPPNSPLFDQMYSNGACKGGLIPSPPCKVVTRAEPKFAAARSRHPGGVQVLFGDGSVKFIKNTINLFTWCAISSTQGGEVISADAY